MNLSITGGKCLLPGGFADVDLGIADGVIAAPAARARRLDAIGLLVLPGIVDLHGDAFERQIQPRPGVSFPVPLALADTEAQLVANGITTAFHGITLSWEPGLRSAQTWTAILDALDAARPRSRCDMRVHLRWEAFNLDALGLALDAIGAGRVHLGLWRTLNRAAFGGRNYTQVLVGYELPLGERIALTADHASGGGPAGATALSGVYALNEQSTVQLGIVRPNSRAAREAGGRSTVFVSYDVDFGPVRYQVVGQHLLPVQLPVGILTAAVGAPYLLYLLVRSNRIGHGG